MAQNKNLILGGLGFIGHNLVDKLLTNGESVHVIDANVQAQNWNLKEVYKDDLFFTVEAFDCSDVIKLFETINRVKPDRVFHLAANSDISKSGEIQNDYRNTLLTTLSLCEVIRAGTKIPTVIFASSSAIYGDSQEPMSVASSSLCIPQNDYGWTKRASELALMATCKKVGTNLVVARFPNVVGPHLTHGLLFDLFRKRNTGEKVIQILGDGSQKKPFIHVSDLLQILIQKSETARKPELTFNIAPLDQITVKEIITIFDKETKSDLTFLYQEQREGWPGDVPEYAFDLEECRSMETLTNTTSAQAVQRAIQENL